MRGRALRAGTAIACGAAFVLLVRRIARGDTREADVRWTARIGVRERGAMRVSFFAEPRIVLLETLAVAALPGLAPRDRAAILLAPATAGLAGQLVKQLVARERPAKSRFTREGDQSCPSTHSAYAAALALTLADVARRHGAGRWVYAVALAVASAVAIARVRCAAHWPSDVAAGALLGAASFDITAVLLRRD